MVNMVKGMISQFKNIQAEEFEEEDIITNAAPFPLETKLNKDLFLKSLEDPGPLFQITDLQNGFTEIDGKEYPTNSFSLGFSFVPLPCFQCINAWYENVSVEDTEGNNLKMDEKEVEKYREMGIIDDDFAFVMQGEFSETYWLNREIQWQENIKASGTIKLDYPNDYEMVVLKKNNTETTNTIGNVDFKLVEIDRNIATILVKGDRRKIESVKVILLNSDLLPFGSVMSVSLDADLYDIENKGVRDLTDEEIQKRIENFNMSDLMVEQVRKIKVRGNISNIVLLKVNSTETLEKEFKLELSWEF